MMSAARYQTGSVVFDRRRGSWHFLWWSDGKRHSQRIGSLADFPTRNAAKIAAQPLQEKLWKPGASPSPSRPVTVAELVTRYRAERMPTRYSTRRGYEVWIRVYVMPRWSALPITDVQPRDAELWLQSLQITPKSRAEVRAILSRLWDFAMWAGDVPTQRNPMSLVRVHGASKRTKQPVSLTDEEFQRFVVQLREPFRTVALLCVSLGLRISECMALKWSDVDWLDSKLTVERGIVTGRVGDVKTAGSRRAMLLAPEIVAMLQTWKSATQFSSSCDWMFASPTQLGRLPWSYPRTWRVFRDAAMAAGLGPFGTHSLRHTYRSWLDSIGSSMAVQQKLMRHSDIRTTMRYGDVDADAMTAASGRVADLAFNGLRTDCNPAFNGSRADRKPS